MKPLFTPDRITSLNPNEIFVFGSNLQGRHLGGAARIAQLYFGAVWGQGVGLQGQSYAIPTMQGGVETIKPYVDQFLDFAAENDHLLFYVTRIGCGIAGFSDDDIAPLFRRGIDMDNVVLPRKFLDVLHKMNSFPSISMPTRARLLMQGQTRTLADIAMALNDINHFRTVDEFFNEFDKIISDYMKRGTVSSLAVENMYQTLRDNESLLMGLEGFRYIDFDRLVELVDGMQTERSNSMLDAIYSRREKTKILRIAALLNNIMQYTDAKDLIQDLYAIASGRYNCGDNSYLNDSFHYPLHYFKHGVFAMWQDILTDGVMDNSKLEKLMFTDHERKLRSKGLEATLCEDFKQTTGCHPNRYLPKRIGTAPVYVIDDSYYDHCSGFGVLTKSCGEGIGPNSCDSLYEFRIVEPILKRECREGGSYIYCNDRYYVPIDYKSKRPVFDQRYGILRFGVWQLDKKYFVWGFLKDNRR